MTKSGFSRSMRLLILLSGAALLPCAALAQPDAGQTLQQLRQPPQPTAKTQKTHIAVPERKKTAHGGPSVSVKKVVLHGNTAFTDEQILEAVGGPGGGRYDLAGMKDIADRITAFYQASGYPFARAVVPQQSMKGGSLRIEIVEGRYGAVQVTGGDARAAQAQKFLSSLEKGEIIESAPLERATLLLNDQPGYTFTPVIHPGRDMGTGDLDARMQRDALVTGSAGVDDYGDRYTGRIRAHADLALNSPFLFGDRISVSALYTQEDMWLGSLGYSLPLGYSGLRGNVGYSHTYYELGGEFASLDAHGTADVASAGLSYPLLRSQQKNLSLSGVYQHKWLQDIDASVSSDHKKSSDSLPLTLSFDARDALGGGGITYGTASWTQGFLHLDSGLKLFDDVSSKTAGSYGKFNADVARLQTVIDRVSIFGRVAGQLAANNLDSSESFGLGGQNGVRAYPAGEGYGDEGVLGQAELRYSLNDNLAPYVFYDAGHIKFHHNPWTAGKNTRTVAGPGLGLRLNKDAWSGNISLAWHTVGGAPTSDSRNEIPVVWAGLSRQF